MAWLSRSPAVAFGSDTAIPPLRLISLLVSLLLIVEFPQLAHGTASWNPSNVPNPLRAGETCGRSKPTSWVCDPEHVISIESANILDDLLMNIHRAIEHPCGGGSHGYEIGLCIIPATYITAPMFASDLRLLTWNLRSDHCDNGLVIVLIASSKTIGFSLGPDVQAKVSQDQLAAAQTAASKYLENGQFYEALNTTISLIGTYVREGSTPNRGWIVAVVFGSILFVVCCLIATACACAKISDRRKLGRKFLRSEVEYKLNRIEDEKARLRQIQKAGSVQAAMMAEGVSPHCLSCPICLEVFNDFIRPTVVLPCSHKFCMECLHNFGRGNRRVKLFVTDTGALEFDPRFKQIPWVCPISAQCNSQHAAPPLWKNLPLPPTAPTGPALGRPVISDVGFRVRQLRNMFPDFVSARQAQQWSRLEENAYLPRVT